MRQKKVRNTIVYFMRVVSLGQRTYLRILLLGLSFFIIFFIFSPVMFSIFFLELIKKKNHSQRKQIFEANKSQPQSCSIIIPSWNGKQLLAECLPPLLEAIKYDNNEHEIIVVDDGSVDGTIQFLRAEYPFINVIALKRNVGFAQAVNIAVKKSRNDIVVFLNNDMIVDKCFLRHLLKHFDRPDIFAVTCALKMEPHWIGGVCLKETGLTKGNFRKGFCYVWQDEITNNNPQPVLYLGGGSSACSKEKFLMLGGFDTLYRPFYYEDVDLSIRAYKNGWKILLEPESRMYHKYRSTIKCFNADLVELIRTKNAILFVWKNITDGIFLINHFIFLALRIIITSIRGESSFIKALLRALWQLPEALFKRLNQPRSAVTEQNIIGPTSEFFLAQYSPKQFFSPTSNGGRARVLIFGHSPLPFENELRHTSQGFRTWHFVKYLLDRGHVVLMIGARLPQSYNEKKSFCKIVDVPSHNLSYYCMEMDLFENIPFLQKVHDSFGPDCIIAVNMYPAAIASAINTKKPFWADLYGYYMGEAQAKAYVYDDDSVISLFWHREKRVLERADVFSVASLPQKYALIGELGARGRLNKSTFGYEFIYVIPSAVEQREYTHQKNVLRGKLVDPDDVVVLWSGGYNTWTNIEILFEGVTRAMELDNSIKFVSTGGHIPGHDEKTFQKFLVKVNKSKFKDRFIFTGWIHLHDIPNYYFESDMGINIDTFCYETLIGTRYRITDMLKSGLPVITTSGTEISGVVEKYNLGKTFPIGDPEALKDAILYFSHQKELLPAHREYIKKVFNENFKIDKLFTPVGEWVDKRYTAPNRGHPSYRMNKYKNLLRRSVISKYLLHLKKGGFLYANRRVLHRLKEILK